MRKWMLVLGVVILPMAAVAQMSLGGSGLLIMEILGGAATPMKGSIPTETSGLASVETVFVTPQGNYTVTDASDPKAQNVEMSEDLQVMMQNAGTCFAEGYKAAQNLSAYEAKKAVWGCDGGGIHQDRKVANTNVYSLHKVAQACDGKTMEVDGYKFDYLQAVAGNDYHRRFYLAFFQCYGEIADQFIEAQRNNNKKSYWYNFKGPIDKTRAADGKFTHVIHWYRDDHKDHFHISAPFIDGIKPSGYSTY